jgi:hypothetical protein
MSSRTSSPARAIARQAVIDLLRETDPGAFAPHFEHPDTRTEREDPTPLAAVRAGRQLLAALHRGVIEAALSARGLGETWEEVASALELQSEGRPDCAAAYLTALGIRADDPWWSPSAGVAWTCLTCEEVVRDYGPDAGGPDDRESGHAVTCSRHAAEVVAWDALWA